MTVVGQALDDLVDNDLTTPVYHPLGFPDRLSTTRLLHARRCRLRWRPLDQYLYALYDNQPPEGSAGLSDEQLVQLGLQSGLDEVSASAFSRGRRNT